METLQALECLRDQALEKLRYEFAGSHLAAAVISLRMSCGPSRCRSCGDVPMAAFSVITYGRIWGVHRG